MARLFAEARRTGVQVRRLYLDREFYEYETLSWLKAEGYTVITPMRLGSRQRKKWEHGKRSSVSEPTLRVPKGREAPLSLRVHVVGRYQKGRKWNRRGARYLVYEVIGHVADDAPEPSLSDRPTCSIDRGLASRHRTGSGERRGRSQPVAPRRCDSPKSRWRSSSKVSG